MEEEEKVECKKCNTKILKTNALLHSLQCGHVGTTRRHPAPVKDTGPNTATPSSHIHSVVQEHGPALQEQGEVGEHKETAQTVEEPADLAETISSAGLSLTVKGDGNEPNAQTRAEDYVGVPIRMLADNEYSNEKDLLAEDAKLAALLQLEEQFNAAPRFASVAVGQRRPAPTLVLSPSASAAAPNVGVSSSFAYSKNTTPAEDIKRLQELRAQNAARANSNMRQTLPNSLPNLPPCEVPPNPNILRSGASSPHENQLRMIGSASSAAETDQEMAQRIAREEEARYVENQANRALAQRLQREEEEAGRRGLHDMDIQRRVAQLKEQRAEEESKKWSRRFDPYMQERNTRVLPSASAASPSASAARLTPVHDETDEEMAFRLALQERTAGHGQTGRPTGIKKAQEEDDVFNFERLRELKKQNAVAVQVARNAYRNAEEANRWENTHDRDRHRAQQNPTVAVQHHSQSRQLGAAPPRPLNTLNAQSYSPNSGQNARVLLQRDSPSMLLETDEEMARRIAQEEERRFLQNEASLALALRLQREERDARGVSLYSRGGDGGRGSNNRAERPHYRDMYAEREEAKAEGYSLEDEIRARGREADTSRERRRHAPTVAVVDSTTRSRPSGARGHRGAYTYAQPQSTGEDFERLDDDAEEVEKRFDGSTLNFSKNKRPNEGYYYYRRRGV